MTGILSCTCSSTCRAVSDCDRSPRFQAHLVAPRNKKHPGIRRRTEACACHLGVMVVAMTTWAREQELTSAYITILTIEPPARESYPKWQWHRSYAQTSGLVFSVIHLGESECVPADMSPVSSDNLYLGWPRLSAENRRDQVQHRFFTVDGNPASIPDAA
jgi:hypothetical protein